MSKLLHTAHEQGDGTEAASIGGKAAVNGDDTAADNAAITEADSIRVYSLDQLSDTMNQVLESGGEFRFYPRGTSMLPLLRQGIDSVALVAAPEKLRRRDIPLYKRSNGQYVLHRVVGEDASGYIMCGDNQTALEHGVRHSQILGVVASIYRGKKHRRYEVTSPGYSIYSVLWCVMPLRKLCMLCRRGAAWLVRHLKRAKGD